MPIDLTIDPLVARWQAIGLTQTQVATYSGVATGPMSRAVNHVANLCYQDFRVVENLVLACEEISRRAGAPVDWRDGRCVRNLLENYHNEKLNPPKPLSPAEARLLHRFAQGEALDDLSTEAGQTRTQFLEMITNFLQRTNRITQMEAAKQ